MDMERKEGEELEEAGSPIGNLMDSKTSHLDDLLQEKLSDAFDRHAPGFIIHEVVKIASEYDPIDIAYAVTKLPAHERVIVYENLPDLQAKIIFLINAGSNTRAAIFRKIDDLEIKQLVERMPPDEAVWVLDDMSDRRMKRVFDLLDPKKALRIRDLQRHDRHSAGRLMKNEFFSFHMNTRIGEVAAAIRGNPGIEVIRRIFVTNDQEELVGFVPERNLIINPDHLPLRQVMRPVHQTVMPDTSRDEVVDLVERYGIPVLPVVNEDQHLVGVITSDAVVEAMEDIAQETISYIAGTGEDISEHESITKRFFWRAPWLLVTLCIGLVTSTCIAHFTSQVWFAFVPLFIPLINGMSGNVGIQCSTILVRGMSTGELSSGSRRKVIGKELGIGLLIGSIFGLFCGLAIYTLNFFGVYHAETDPVALGVMVSLGLLSACMTATTLGTFSPFLFAYLRMDPAVAAGPIVMAFNDLFSTLMFFFVAWIVNLFLPI